MNLKQATESSLAHGGLSIAEMARRTGLSAHTLRYYERAGLMRAVSRNAGGHRRYGAEDTAWIAFVHRLRETGMSIRQMRAFAQLRSQGDATLAARHALLQAHLEALDQRLARLQECRGALGEKLDHYRELQEAMTLPPAKPRKGNSHDQEPSLLPLRTRPAKAE